MIEGPLSEERLREDDELSQERVAVELISNTSSERTAVYRLEYDNGETRFLRVLTDERAESVRAVDHVGPHYGFPECRLISGTPPLLIMDQAPGHALSRYLPFVLLPGVYKFKRSDFTSAIENFGTYLGRLHHENQGDGIQLSQTRVQAVVSDRSKHLPETIGKANYDQVRSLIKQYSDRKFPSCRLHSDPTPHNVFYSNGDVTLIDFSLREGLPASDVIRAERGLVLMNRRLPYSRARGRKLGDHFRRGYESQCSLFVRDELFTLFRCALDCYLLDRLLSQNSSKRGAKIARLTDVSVLERRIQDALMTLS